MPKKILMVEDNFQTQNILSNKLKKLGYKVSTFSVGKKGIEAANKTNPDLILLDILIEGEYTGIETLEKIKKIKNLKDIPIIVLTNLDNQKERAEKLGANEYLIKANISLNEIIDKVNYYLKD